MNIIEEARKVFDIEIKGLKSVKDSLNKNFIKIANQISFCKGKVVTIGVGKSGYIAMKFASTLSSLGIASIYIHPTEALHGDLGKIEKKDLVIALSNSGESEEIIKILGNIKSIGSVLIGISGNRNSTLIKNCDYFHIFGDLEEACHIGLAPTTSTTASLVYGDALAVVASMINGFDREKYALFHPAGSLGKKLIVKVKDIMQKDENNAMNIIGDTLKNAIVVMGKKGLGITTIIDSKKNIKGVITDGDLRRKLEEGIDIYNLLVNDVMTKKPITFDENIMAIEALEILRKNNISSAPVTNNEKKIIGTVRLQDIIKVGIYK